LGRIACAAPKFELEVLAISSIIVSLALTSKLAKPNRSRYPFLAREIKREIVYIWLNNVPCAESEHSFVFVCLSRSANKQQTRNPGLTRCLQPQLPQNHTVLCRRGYCILGQLVIT
jgi:DNA-binding LytR/AlgR family response regulator